MRVNKLFAFALCIVLLASTTAPLARADEGLFNLLDTPAGRFLLSETTEGSAIMARLLGADSASSDLRSLADRLAQPGMEDIRTHLSERIQRARDLLRERHADLDESADAADLSPEERVLLREMAARELRMAGSGEPGSIEFVPPEGSGGTLAANRERFLEPGPEDPADQAPDRNPDPETRAKGRRRVRQWLDDMRQCVRSRPPSAQRSADLRYLLTGLGISEAMTVGGYVVSSGQKEIAWADMSTDIVTTAIGSVIGNRLLTGNATYMVRWMKILAFNTGRSAVDATIYYINPYKDTHGEPVGEVTEDRLSYNIAYGVATSGIPIGLYALISGLECLYPGAKAHAIGTGIRLVNSAATNWIYFKGRRHFVEHDR